MALNEVNVSRENEGVWLDLTGKVPGAEGVSVKVHAVDDASGQVVMSARFKPGARMPRHVHHCTAIAYTISGSWSYDDGTYYAGDVVFESLGNNHLPFSDEGTEMLLVFGSPSGQYLDNQLDDGTCFHLGMPLFRKMNGMTAADWANLNVLEHVELLPAMREPA